MGPRAGLEDVERRKIFLFCRTPKAILKGSVF
jgi:hypothetical protein